MIKTQTMLLDYRHQGTRQYRHTSNHNQFSSLLDKFIQRLNRLSNQAFQIQKQCIHIQLRPLFKEQLIKNMYKVISTRTAKPIFED